MRKYKNITNKINIIIIPINIIFFGGAVLSTIFQEDFASRIVVGIGFPLCAILFDSMYWTLQDIFYTTYIFEDKIYQKYLYKAKCVMLNEIKTIYVFDDLIILSKEKKDMSLVKINFRFKKKLNVV